MLFTFTRPGKGATTGPVLCLEDKATGRNLAHDALALCKGREAGEAHAQQGLAMRKSMVIHGDCNRKWGTK